MAGIKIRPAGLFHWIKRDIYDDSVRLVLAQRRCHFRCKRILLFRTLLRHRNLADHLSDYHLDTLQMLFGAQRETGEHHLQLW